MNDVGEKRCTPTYSSTIDDFCTTATPWPPLAECVRHHNSMQKGREQAQVYASLHLSDSEANKRSADSSDKYRARILLRRS